MKFIEKSNGIKVMQLPFILNFKNKSQLLNNKNNRYWQNTLNLHL